eukprot:278349_1
MALLKFILLVWQTVLLHNCIAITDCINGSALELCVSNEYFGAISSISTQLGLNLTTIGYSWIGNTSYFNPNQIISTNISSPNSNSITIIKDISSKDSNNNPFTLTLNDTYTILTSDPTTIEWILTINNVSCATPFSTIISTQLNLSNVSSTDMHYWTMQSGTFYSGNNGYKPFVDVLQLLNGTNIDNTLYTQIGQDYVDASIQKNTPNKHTRNVSVFPISIFTSKQFNHGISLIYDINKDTLLGGTMNINSNHQLFRRYNNRLSNKMQPLTFTTYIRLNKGFTWRDTLNWTVNKFSNLFKPSGQPSKIDNIVNNAGLGLYTCAAAEDIDVINVVNNSGANICWDASFWYVYQSMSLPPVANWSSYLGPEEQGYCGAHFTHGEESTRPKIASHYYNMSQIGITTVSYYNLFEWGEFVKWPIDISNVNISDNIWLNSTLYLNVYMNDSVVLDAKGNSIHEGPYQGIVLDPGVDSYYNRLINQTYEHIYSFDDKFYGLGIDRQDWTVHYNYRRGDGYSYCTNSKGIWTECASLLLSWKRIAKAVGHIVHNEYTKNNAIITTNYQKQRMELLEITDVMFTEQSNLQYVNSNGLSSMAMHCIEWTYNSTEVLVKYGGPHLYFQERLYMNVHPMAPVIGADHSIYPNSTVQEYYNAYNLLFRALRGVTWWLLEDTIDIIEKTDQAHMLILSLIMLIMILLLLLFWDIM